jgi:hypothetical protein
MVIILTGGRVIGVGRDTRAYLPKGDNDYSSSMYRINRSSDDTIIKQHVSG